MIESITNIGSYVIIEKTYKNKTIYTVKYVSKHNIIYQWQFINNKLEAENFARQKTVIDNKLNRGKK